MIINEPPMSYAACNAEQLRKGDPRPAHPFTDKRVRLKEGAVTKAFFRSGASLRGGGPEVGLCWVVAKGQAVVDFGVVNNVPLRVVANEADVVLAE